MKLDEIHYSLATIITHFLDKAYQECITLYIRKNNVRIGYVPCDFISLYLIVVTFNLIVVTFKMRLKITSYKSH